MSKHNHIYSTELSLNKRALILALTITAVMTVIEFIAGYLANSLALIGDAGHMLTDSLALLLALFALLISQKPANYVKTFGYYRAEILAALFNGAILLVIAFYIFYEASRRFLEPPAVKSTLMLFVALIGLTANLGGIFILKKTGVRNLNVRGAFLHMLGDALSSVGVILAGIIILATGWNIVDPIIACLIGIVILRGAISLVIEASNILLESVPKHVNLQKLKAEMERVEGINAVHDLHLWTITSGFYALSCHILIDDQKVSEGTSILNTVNKLLAEKFNISHTTIQLECRACESGLICRIEK